MDTERPITSESQHCGFAFSKRKKDVQIIPVNATTSNTVRVSTAQPSKRKRIFTATGSNSNECTPRKLQSAATGLTGLSRPGTNFSSQRPQTSVSKSKAATVNILKQNLGMLSNIKSTESLEGLYGMPNIPFYEPEETDRETPFFKSLTAEYMSTI